MLDAAARTELLKLARTALEEYYAQGFVEEHRTSCEELSAFKGAFISLHKGDNLRGCIGQIYPDRELHKIVQNCALSAALEDARFQPVRAEELCAISIEISVLTPFRQIHGPEDVEVGRHGLYIQSGRFRGLLLPQVATQNMWDRETFLSQTCRKAGLPESAWRDPHTTVQTFEAEVFSE
jgi:AmmeMemoRadiSam system protein A